LRTASILFRFRFGKEFEPIRSREKLPIFARAIPTADLEPVGSASVPELSLAPREELLLNDFVPPSNASPRPRNPWAWIPTLYLAEGLPYVTVMTVAVIMYKAFGFSNTDIALYTSWLYLPWVIKPLWSPVVDLLRTRRWWIWAMQLLLGASLAGVALTIPAPRFFQMSLAFLWLVAFSSATHDIAADGFYMLANTERQQAFFSGIRNTFYRIASIAGQGWLVMLAGNIQDRTGNTVLAWTLTFGTLGGLMACFGIYHGFILPKPATDQARSTRNARQFLNEFFLTFASFFRKPGISGLICFLLFYRFAEAQLVKMVAPFLLDARDAGGLELTTSQVGLVYGNIGVIALMCGGVLGGFLISRNGLKFWLWPMVFAMHLPDAVFVYLAYAQPQNLAIIGAYVAVEQFGYGFGFAAYMLYMIYAARGEHRTAHYAICTGFMALGMMLPGMWSGWLQELIGYKHFFTWVILATIPSFLVVLLIPLDAEFGKKGPTTNVHE
jgi:MFS transporter, PAT family, beta-lactamase induction signal transducer AmpG